MQSRLNNLNFSYANIESNAKSIKLCFKENSNPVKPVNSTVQAMAKIPTEQIEKQINIV